MRGAAPLILSVADAGTATAEGVCGAIGTRFGTRTCASVGKACGVFSRACATTGNVWPDPSAAAGMGMARVCGNAAAVTASAARGLVSSPVMFVETKSPCGCGA